MDLQRFGGGTAKVTWTQDSLPGDKSPAVLRGAAHIDLTFYGTLYVVRTPLLFSPCGAICVLFLENKGGQKDPYPRNSMVKFDDYVPCCIWDPSLISSRFHRKFTTGKRVCPRKVSWSPPRPR